MELEPQICDNLSDFSARGIPKQNCVQKRKTRLTVVGSHRTPNFREWGPHFPLNREHDIFVVQARPLILRSSTRHLTRDEKTPLL